MSLSLTPRRATLLLAAAVALVYSNSLEGPFVFDDLSNIRDNPGIRTLWPLRAALNPPPAELAFFTRPFINLTMCVDYALWKLNPRGYRLTNLLFHLAASLTLFGLLRRTFQQAAGTAFAAALLWAVHPLNTSAVNYLAQRGELAVGLFLFLMLYGLNRAVENRPAAPPSAFWFATVLLVGLLGMGSKENMLAAPILAVLYDRMFLSSAWREVVQRRGRLYAVLALTWLWPLSRHLAYSPHVRMDTLSGPLIGRYLLTQAWGLARMIRLTFWPTPLIFDYGTDLITKLAEVRLQIGFLLFLLALTAWSLFRMHRAGFAGLAFFALLAPSALLPITGQPIAEHRAYAPLAALIALAVVAGEHIGRRLQWSPRAAHWIVVVLALLLGGASFRRNFQFRTADSLLADTIRKRPGNARAWYNLGVVRQEAGRLDEALQAYTRSIELNPSDPKALSNRALIHFQRSQWGSALADLNRWIEVNPTSSEARARRGEIWRQLGDFERARQDFDAALAGQPAGAAHFNNLAWLLATAPDERVRDGARAVQLAERAVEMMQRDYRALDTLAAAYAAASDFEKARGLAREAIRRARETGDEAFAQQVEPRLACYLENRPWTQD